MITISNLVKTFAEEKGQELTVLNHINLTIEKGDIYGIIGMSGAGKSTMLKLIGLLDTPTSGQVLVEGIDLATLTGMDKIAYYKSIGTVFQGYNLLMQKTVFENIAFPLKLSKYDNKTVEERVLKLLDLVGLSDKAQAYPSKLSGGQKQRVAIARALASQPKILLCDEPTSALDSLTTKAILKLLSQINEQLGVTIVIITHEIQVVKTICNKVAVLDHGVMVDHGLVSWVMEEGTHPMTKELFSKGGE